MQKLVDLYIRNNAEELFTHQAYEKCKSTKLALHSVTNLLWRSLETWKMSFCAFLNLKGAFNNTSYQTYLARNWKYSNNIIYGIHQTRRQLRRGNIKRHYKKKSFISLWAVLEIYCNLTVGSWTHRSWEPLKSRHPKLGAYKVLLSAQNHIMKDQKTSTIPM